MRLSTITTLFALAASQVTAQYNMTSKPFNLVLLSQNATLNGTALYACHEGAAIEGLCTGPLLSPESDTFQFNTSYYTTDPPTTSSGYLTWLLRGGNFILSQPMSLSYSPTSNVALPLFTPAEYGTLVQFDGTGKMNIPGWVDDTVVPINTNAPRDYYRWWVCETYYGYRYQTLAWVVGTGEPQNPTCVKVEVARVFVKE